MDHIPNIGKDYSHLSFSLFFLSPRIIIIRNEFEKLISVSGLTKSDVGTGRTIPKELICPLCQQMLNNAVLIPCCMESACDECIRFALIEKYNFHCPLCQSSVVPDDLLPNKALRRAVETFKLGKSSSSTAPFEEEKPRTGGKT